METHIVWQLAKTATVLVLAVFFIRLSIKAGAQLEKRQWLAPTLRVIVQGAMRWFVMITAALLLLAIFGVPISTLWAGILSAILVVAVAFFAAWSILSNMLSSLLLLTFSRARVGDIVELRDTKQDEVGIRGRLIDINLFYVTLQELHADQQVSDKPAIAQVPCHLFFFRVTRCWAGESTQPLVESFNQSPTPLGPTVEQSPKESTPREGSL